MQVRLPLLSPRASHVRDRPARRARGVADRRHRGGVPAPAGPQDALRWMWLGVGLAVTPVHRRRGGAAPRVARSCPRGEQEQLETVIGLVAVGMITWMIVWMRNHAADLRGELQERAGAALVDGSTAALIGMAFLAVLREGLETAVFLARSLPGLGSTGAHRQRRGARDPGRRRPGLWHLPRWREDQPRQVLPHHRRCARLRRRGSSCDGGAHRARGGLVEPPAPSGRRPQLADQAGHRRLRADHRHVRHPAQADGR